MRKQIAAYTPCSFIASTNAGPFHVDGSFFEFCGLCVVLHAGYGADKGSKLLFASEYGSGILIASGKRSEINLEIAGYIASCGGLSEAKEKLLETLKRNKMDALNSLLLPSQYWNT